MKVEVSKFDNKDRSRADEEEEGVPEYIKKYFQECNSETEAHKIEEEEEDGEVAEERH